MSFDSYGISNPYQLNYEKFLLCGASLVVLDEAGENSQDPVQPEEDGQEDDELGEGGPERSQERLDQGQAEVEDPAGQERGQESAPPRQDLRPVGTVLGRTDAAAAAGLNGAQSSGRSERDGRDESQRQHDELFGQIHFVALKN